MPANSRWDLIQGLKSQLPLFLRVARRVANAQKTTSRSTLSTFQSAESPTSASGKLRKAPIGFVMSVLCAFINWTPTTRICRKFRTGDLYENLSRISQIWVEIEEYITHFTRTPKRVSQCWQRHV